MGTFLAICDSAAPSPQAASGSSRAGRLFRAGAHDFIATYRRRLRYVVVVRRSTAPTRTRRATVSMLKRMR